MNGVAPGIRVQFRRAGMRAIQRKRVIADAEADLQGIDCAVDDLAGHSQAGQLGRRQRAGVGSHIAGVVDVECVAVPIAVDCQDCTDRIDVATGDRGRAADVDGICIRPRVDGCGSSDRLNMNDVAACIRVQFRRAGMRAIQRKRVIADAEADLQGIDCAVDDLAGHSQAGQLG